MPLKSFLIGPVNSGIQRNLEPWLIPEDAFEFMTNAFIFRGRVKKRFGTSLLGGTFPLSQLRINVGTTAAITGDFSVTVPGLIFGIGQTFTIGSTLFTVNALGNPSTLLTTGTATGTYDTTTGALVITGNTENPSTDVFFYPAEPVMGLLLRETLNVNVEETIGFDTQFAYSRTGGGWVRLGAVSWTGGNSDFYWHTNYRGANPYESYFYVVNGVAADNIKYIPVGLSTWTNLRPQLDVGATRFLESASIIVGYKDRLVLLNTIEDETGTDRTYVNRARWSQNGDPTVAATSWLDDTPGRGGYVDAPTQQAIITAEFLKDDLIVYFERSTWKLRYNQDPALPFIWEQLNSELGAESTFSIVGFDDVSVGVGNVGIHACNGVNVKRIDELIPDEIFNIHNGNDGPQRVYGIRDYYRELVYWTFPDDTANPTFPTNVLVWNYQNGQWALFDDTYTCFGNLQREDDLIWSEVGAIFGTWAEWNAPWGGAASQSQFPFIVAGNQQGVVCVVDADKASNSQSLLITDMNAGTEELSVVNHNLAVEEYVLVEGCQGITSLNDSVFQVQSVVDEDTLILDTTFSGTYTGGGKLTRISNFNIQSKQWNPGTPIGQQFRLPFIDLLLDRTELGEIAVDYLTDFNSGVTAQDEAQPTNFIGSNVVFTKPENPLGETPSSRRLWHRYFLNGQATTIQIKIFMTDEQMRDTDISQSEFQLNAILLYVEPSGRITG